jgi:3'(2'), 5'-bisphosphate nucleotidase
VRVKLVFPTVTAETELELDLLPLALQACALLSSLYARPRGELATATKTDAYDLVTEADKAVQDLCASWIAAHSGAPLVGEEGGADEGSDLFWSLDPLDGTREFVESQGEFAFQLALVAAGIPVLAIVGMPAWDLVYIARKDQGCRILRLSDQTPVTLPTLPSRRERLLVSRSLGRRNDLQALLEAHPSQDREPCGGVGAKVHAILWGIGDTYLTVPQGMYGWDLAAPLLVAQECGLHASDLDGNPLRVPTDRSKVSQGILITRIQHAESNLRFLKLRA